LDKLKQQVQSGKIPTDENAIPSTQTIDGEDISGYISGDNFVYVDSEGNVKNTTIQKIDKANRADEKGIIEANYSLLTDRLKRNGNYKDWYTATEQYVQYLRDYMTKLDPKKDAKELISTQNKIEDLINQAQKRTGFGGTSKKFISDAELLSAYKKALDAASSPAPRRNVQSISNILKPVQLKHQVIKPLR